MSDIEKRRQLHLRHAKKRFSSGCSARNPAAEDLFRKGKYIYDVDADGRNLNVFLDQHPELKPLVLYQDEHSGKYCSAKDPLGPIYYIIDKNALRGRSHRGPGRPHFQFMPSIEMMEKAEQLLGKEWPDITDEDFESLSAEQREELSQL